MMKIPSTRPLPFPHGIRIAGRPVCVCEKRGDPLAAFPSLALDGRAYNRWLAAEILDGALLRWSGEGAAGDAAAEAGAGCGRARLAFQEILPAAIALGDPAVLAAMGVTANLQRTLAFVAGLLSRPATGRAALIPIRISRVLCGLADHPAGSPRLPARAAPPAHADRRRPGEPDPRLVRCALGCPEGDIERCCEEALCELGRRVRSDDDLRPLRPGTSRVLR
jgi:hypothetical protein